MSVWPPKDATEFELEVARAILAENIVGVERSLILARAAISAIVRNPRINSALRQKELEIAGLWPKKESGPLEAARGVGH